MLQGSSRRQKQHCDDVERPEQGRRERDDDLGEGNHLIPCVEIVDQVVGEIDASREPVERKSDQPQSRSGAMLFRRREYS